MAKIIITLSKESLGDLLLGGEISISESRSNLTNINDITIKLGDYDYATEVEE